MKPPALKKNKFKIKAVQRLRVFFLAFLLNCAQQPPSEKPSSAVQPPDSAQKPLKPPHPLTKTTQALLKKECRIPLGTQIVHYPMIHKKTDIFNQKENYPEYLDQFFDNLASYSQFILTNILRNYSNIHIFYEGLSRTFTSDMLKKGVITSVIEYENNLTKITQQDIAALFKNGIPSRFSLLSRQQKIVISQIGGGMLAFMLGHIDQIHRVVSPEKQGPIRSQIQTSIENYNQIMEELRPAATGLQKPPPSPADLENKYAQLDTAQAEIEHLIFDVREQALQAEVERFISQQPHSSTLVLIAYGAAHELSDNFSSSRFYELPHACTMPEHYLSDPNYALFLLHKSENTDSLSPQSQIESKSMRQTARLILEQALIDYKIKGENQNFWNTFANRPFNQREIEMFIDRSHRPLPSYTAIIKNTPTWLEFQ